MPFREEAVSPDPYKAPEANATVSGQPVLPSTAVKTPKILPKIFMFLFSLCGMIAGAIAIVRGSEISDRWAGDTVRDMTYGGDAYTGIQNAAAQTANNVHALTFTVQTAASALLTVFGIALLAYFGYRLFKTVSDWDR